MLHEELSRKIIGASMTVLNSLRPGLDEKIYENALVLELDALGIKSDQQHEYVVEYRGQRVGRLIPDLIVNETVIVDAKVVSAFNEIHIAQMLGYLNITNLDLALLISFKENKLKWKRVVNEEKGKE